ncbi:hypothetical protein KAR91_04745 [Candidatus Pacearchaeota archaeon]|nr:hypothetical protein [Candidatus Pacearchaeota archaeon]
MSDGCADAYRHRQRIEKIASHLGAFFKGNFSAGHRWLHAKNPFFNNREPGDEIKGFGSFEALEYIKEHMDPRVRKRCLRYRSVK